jgi:hypothetical protein
LSSIRKEVVQPAGSAPAPARLRTLALSALLTDELRFASRITTVTPEPQTENDTCLLIAAPTVNVTLLAAEFFAAKAMFFRNISGVGAVLTPTVTQQINRAGAGVAFAVAAGAFGLLYSTGAEWFIIA